MYELLCSASGPWSELLLCVCYCGCVTCWCQPRVKQYTKNRKYYFPDPSLWLNLRNSRILSRSPFMSLEYVRCVSLEWNSSLPYGVCTFVSAALSPSQGVLSGSPFLGDASDFPSEVFTGPAEIPASVPKLLSLGDSWEMLSVCTYTSLAAPVIPWDI